MTSLSSLLRNCAIFCESVSHGPCKGNQPVRPKQRGVTGMYLAGRWYRLSARSGTYDPDNAMAALGVSILSDLILEPLLDIRDQRAKPRPGSLTGTGRPSSRQQRRQICPEQI